MNIVQALDGRTGELIWENHVGPEAAVGIGVDAQHRDLRTTRSIVATTDARLVALDARTGKMVVGHGHRR